MHNKLEAFNDIYVITKIIHNSLMLAYCIFMILFTMNIRDRDTTNFSLYKLILKCNVLFNKMYRERKLLY